MAPNQAMLREQALIKRSQGLRTAIWPSAWQTCPLSPERVLLSYLQRGCSESCMTWSPISPTYRSPPGTSQIHLPAGLKIACALTHPDEAPRLCGHIVMHELSRGMPQYLCLLPCPPTLHCLRIVSDPGGSATSCQTEESNGARVGCKCQAEFKVREGS